MLHPLVLAALAIGPSAGAQLTFPVPPPGPADSAAPGSPLVVAVQSSDGNPIEGAVVFVEEFEACGITGPDGWTTVAHAGPRGTTLTVYAAGYTPETSRTATGDEPLGATRRVILRDASRAPHVVESELTPTISGAAGPLQILARVTGAPETVFAVSTSARGRLMLHSGDGGTWTLSWPMDESTSLSARRWSIVALGNVGADVRHHRRLPRAPRPVTSDAPP